MSAAIRIVVWGVVGFAVLAAIAVGYREASHWYASAAMEHTSENIHAEAEKVRAVRRDFVADVRAADKVADPLQRCLHFPDPPSMHWNEALVAEMCRLSALKLVTVEEISRRLARGEAASVDATFDDYATQDADAAKHGIQFRAFESLFESDNPAVGAVVDEWVKQAPGSANALAARGIFRVRSGYEARGTASAGETPDANVEAMRRLVALGVADLEASLKVNPRFAVPATYLLSAHRSGGDQDLIAAEGKRAVELAPTEHRVYIFWLTAASPLWGGSIENLHAIVEAAKPYVDKNPLLQLVNARARMLEWRAAHGRASKADYENVLSIAPDDWALKEIGMVDPSSDPAILSQLVRFAPTVTNYMATVDQLSMSNKADWAAQNAARAVEIGSPTTTSLFPYARALQMTGKPEAAAAAYEKVLEGNPRNEKAMSALAQLYQRELKRHADAVAMAQRYIDAYPDSETAWTVVAFVNQDTDIPKYCAAMTRLSGNAPVESWDRDGKCGGAKPAPQAAASARR